MSHRFTCASITRSFIDACRPALAFAYRIRKRLASPFRSISARWTPICAVVVRAARCLPHIYLMLAMCSAILSNIMRSPAPEMMASRPAAAIAAGYFFLSLSVWRSVIALSAHFIASFRSSFLSRRHDFRRASQFSRPRHSRLQSPGRATALYQRPEWSMFGVPLPRRFFSAACPLLPFCRL